MDTLFLTKKSENFIRKTESILSKWCWPNCIAACRRMQSDHTYRPDKTQVQVDQISQYKSKYSELDRRESGQKPLMHRQRRQFHEQNINHAGIKIYNSEMGLMWE